MLDKLLSEVWQQEYYDSMPTGEWSTLIITTKIGLNPNGDEAVWFC